VVAGWEVISITNYNTMRSIIVFAYSPGVGDTRKMQVRLDGRLVVVRVRMRPLGVIRRAPCG
jgi:hypothetical protein